MEPTAPAFDPTLFDTLKKQLAAAGPNAAIDRLCVALRDAKDYAKLFYAMLMRKRLAMGVSPIPTAGANDLTPAQQEEYEEAIRVSCREVGGRALAEGNIPYAFNFYRMIGEVQPVRDAIEKYSPGPDDDVQPVIDVAYQQAVHPKKGFDLVLDRYGICSAITTASGLDPSLGPDVRAHCVQRLVHSLHGQLFERLKNEVAAQQGFPPTATTIPDLIAGRDWLFGDDMYYTDTSHLSSVVQMSIELDSPPELKLARELCAYGMRLASQLQYPGTPPFENLYRDVDVYLGVMLDDNADAGIEHFRAKITADPDGPDTFATEVLVRLLVRKGREKEALELGKQYLALADERQMNCPGPMELAQRVKDYEAVAELAKMRDDPVHYLAGLIAQK
jgi:hypothetical protein